MYRSLRPLIFRLPPETAHHLTVQCLRLTGSLPVLAASVRILLGVNRLPDRPVQVAGLTFHNAIGLAAGYDKDGLAWRGLTALGFGHLELGTVTPLAQPGNPQPRLFRLVEDRAVINRMGFNNRGADFLAARLRNRKPGGVVIGVNIGKNRSTPLEEAWRDYQILAEKFLPLADYLAVNVSSPNTPGLRDLQSAENLMGILGPVIKERERYHHLSGMHRPIFMKCSPDLTGAELEVIVDTALKCGANGLIAANTTLARDGLRSVYSGEQGGLSGRPLTERSLDFLKKAGRLLNGRAALIASGGVFTSQDVSARLDAGVDLVQVYTALIYEGPGLVKRLAEI